jgi:hypothetical protein
LAHIIRAGTVGGRDDGGVPGADRADQPARKRHRHARPGTGHARRPRALSGGACAWGGYRPAPWPTGGPQGPGTDQGQPGPAAAPVAARQRPSPAGWCPSRMGATWVAPCEIPSPSATSWVSGRPSGVDYMRAEDWDGFLAAMNRWGAPGEDQVPRSLPKPGDPGRSVTDDQAVGSGVSDRDEARRKYTKHASIES